MNLFGSFKTDYLIIFILSCLGSFPANADDSVPNHTMSASEKNTTESHQMDDHNGHGKTPAGIYGGNMIGKGKFMFNYTPMYMRMAGNYIGSSKVSPETIVTTIPSSMMMMGKPVNYRIVPTAMDDQTHMLHAMYGVTDWFDLMVMASYQIKTMDMTSYKGNMGTNVLGSSSSTTEGISDTTVTSLWRVYKDPINKIHINAGLSIPTGSTTESTSMLSPMTGTYMAMRASYGMQLGTGTVDLLPGVTYLGNINGLYVIYSG